MELQQANQIFFRIHRGNDEISTYPATQILIRVTTQVLIWVTQFNASNSPNVRQSTLLSITYQSLFSTPPTIYQPTTLASVHALRAS